MVAGRLDATFELAPELALPAFEADPDDAEEPDDAAEAPDPEPAEAEPPEPEPDGEGTMT